MAIAEGELEDRARRTYEAGRLLLGLRQASASLPMAALSLLACGHPGATALDATLLAGFLVLFGWRGEALGRGARLGLWAGVPPLLLPVLMESGGHFCGLSVCLAYPACLLGGLAGGAVLAAWGLRSEVEPAGLAAAGVVAGLAGALGCLLGGLGGLIGLTAGLGLGATPLLARRRA